MDAKRRPISPQAAARYMRRWPIVRRRLIEEQRAASMDTRLYRLAGLMASAREMGWSAAHDYLSSVLLHYCRSGRRRSIEAMKAQVLERARCRIEAFLRERNDGAALDVLSMGTDPK